MVRRRLPLWLLLDPAAWLALMLGVWRLVGVVREMLAKPDDGRGLLAQADLAGMAEALATTEADIDWAIARQVRRLRGLPVGDVARVVPAPAPARTLGAFRARYEAQTRRMTECDAIARRRATRAMRLPAASLPFDDISAGAAPAMTGLEIFAPCFAVANATRARAPPSLDIEQDAGLQIRSDSGDAGVCACRPRRSARATGASPSKGNA